MTPTLTFQGAIEEVAVHALAKLPPTLHERLARAIALVESCAVFLDEDGVHGQILSSDGETWYTCNGGCTCKDAQYGAPDGLCQHRLAVGLYRRATELMHQPAVLPVNASSSTPEPSPKNDCATGVPEVLKRHVVSIQNKPFVRFAGLLELAHPDSTEFSGGTPILSLYT